MTLFKYLVFILFILPLPGFSLSQAKWYCVAHYKKQMQQPVQQQQGYWLGSGLEYIEGFNPLSDKNPNLPLTSISEYGLNFPFLGYKPQSSYNIKNTRNLDQGTSKECFIFAFVGALESTQLNSQKKNINYYPEYLIAQKLKYTIEGLLEFNEDQTFYNLEGGHFFHALNLTRAVGIVPEGANWQPLKNIEYWPHFDSLYAQIREQTTQEKNYINSLNLSPYERAQQIKQKTEEIFKRVLGPHIGFLPDHFYFQGSYYTPTSFAKNHLSGSGKKITAYYLKNRQRLFHNDKIESNLPAWIKNMPEMDQTQFNNEGLRAYEFLNKIDNELKLGKSIIADLDGETTYSIGHTMVITDIEKRGTDYISIKMKNSFKNNQDGGYIWFRVDEFLTKTRRIWTIDL